MSYAVDLTGKRFGRLLVVSRNKQKQDDYLKQTGNNKAFWNCKCDCGNTVVVSGSSLKNRISPTRSCGCLQKEAIHRQKNTKSITWSMDESNNTVVGTDSHGHKFKIDADDYEKVKDYCWRVTNKGYVVANARNGSNRYVWIHRIIMGAEEDQFVDHKNWDKADNRKVNLRIATKAQNCTNIDLKKNNTTGYTGVTRTRNGRYLARITANGTRHYIGTYDSFSDAVKARHDAEIRLHGEWSGSNNKSNNDNGGDHT